MKKTIGRDLPNGDYIEITVDDHADAHNPYFSITGAIWGRSGTWPARRCAANYREPHSIGQVVDEIAMGAPELAPLLLVHLADPNGVPMHAVANGWYFYTGASREYELEHYGQAYVERAGTDRERAARALHIPVASLPVRMDEARFEQFAASLAGYWLAQAEAARAVLAAMVDGEGVEDR